MRILLSALVGFAVSLLAGKLLIPLLRRLKAGQSIKEDGPTWHMSKQGTPTMGGVMFIIALAVVMICFCGRSVLNGDRGPLLVLLFALVFGAVGFVDDYAKVKKHENTGLTAPQKFLLQLACAIAFTVLLRYEGMLTPNLYLPFVGGHITLPWVVYMVFAAFVMVGTVNAVNITDGVDGLAAGVTLPVMIFFAAVAAAWQYDAFAQFSAGAAGALVGFLIYNFHPAKVFMGDTGSLFLGGLVCGLAFAYDMPLILIPVGVIYIAETASDILQVAYFKATGGKRIFRMAPLHHHFEMGGWSEVKVVLVFAGITVCTCLLSYLAVSGRYY